MALQFTQEEIEGAMTDILKRDDRIDISRITGIYPGVVRSMFNPDDERKSAIFVALQIICALDQIDERRGEQLFSKIVEFRELSRKRKPGASGSLETEVGKFNREFSEFISTKIEGKPIEAQIAELLDIENQLPKIKQALLDEYNRLKETPREMSVTWQGRGNN